MSALRIGLAVGAIGIGIGTGYAIPVSNQHENSNNASYVEHDTRTTTEIYNELIGKSSNTTKPRIKTPSITITPRVKATAANSISPAGIEITDEIVKDKGVTQPILGSLPIIGFADTTTDSTTIFTAKETTLPRTNITIIKKFQSKSSAKIKRRTIFKQARNVGTKARVRSDKRLATAKSRVKQRTKRKQVATRVNKQTMRDRTRFKKTGQARKSPARRR